MKENKIVIPTRAKKRIHTPLFIIPAPYYVIPSSSPVIPSFPPVIPSFPSVIPAQAGIQKQYKINYTYK
jgi:hypothetical protein